MTDKSPEPAAIAFEDAPIGALPTDVLQAISATPWATLRPGQVGPVKVPAVIGADGYADERQARSNRAYDVLTAVRAVAGDTVTVEGVEYRFGTKGTTYADGAVTVRIVLRPATK